MTTWHVGKIAFFLVEFPSRTQSDAIYENTETDELLSMLKDADSLEEQGDILHYLVVTVGLAFVTGSLSSFFFPLLDISFALSPNPVAHVASISVRTGTDNHGAAVTVKDLLKLLYEKACREKQWALVRHSSGEHTRLDFEIHSGTH
jgi:phosphorylase kinase alpha/beta subunit